MAVGLVLLRRVCQVEHDHPDADAEGIGDGGDVLFIGPDAILIDVALSPSAVSQSTERRDGAPLPLVSTTVCWSRLPSIYKI
jgi:hypothetical protein